MARKKRQNTESTIEQVPAGESATAVAEPVAVTPATPKRSEPPPVERPAWIDGPADPMQDHEGQREEPPRNWGEPYKAIFSCPEIGFELGENRRFKQRVFRFNDRPADEIIATLKDSGFTYRAAEKAWTVPANAETRKLTDEMARDWAGPNYIRSVER